MALLGNSDVFSGTGAQGAIRKTPGVSEALIERPPRRGNAGTALYGNHWRPCLGRIVEVSRDLTSGTLELEPCSAILIFQL